MSWINIADQCGAVFVDRVDRVNRVNRVDRVDRAGRPAQGLLDSLIRAVPIAHT